MKFITAFIYLLALFCGLCVLSIAHLKSGPVSTSWMTIANSLFQDDGSVLSFTLREIRLPRLLVAICVGAGLAISGVLIQVITRNPLGDPGVTGVSGGAAFGVAFAITFIHPAPWNVLFFGGLGGLLAACLTFLLSYRAGLRSMHLLLAGIAVSVFFIAATGAIMIMQRTSMQALYFWLIGGFANKGWQEVAMVAPVTVCVLVLVLCLTTVLSALQLDDRIAKGFGVATGKWRFIFAFLSVAVTASAVSVAGPISFVGFVAPHVVRRLYGGAKEGTVSMAMLLCMSVFTGAILTVGADLMTRLTPIGTNAPAGIWITIFGGILFLILAYRISEGKTR